MQRWKEARSVLASAQRIAYSNRPKKEWEELWTGLRSATKWMPRAYDTDQQGEEANAARAIMMQAKVRLEAICSDQKKAYAKVRGECFKKWAAAAVENGLGIAAKFAKPEAPPAIGLLEKDPPTAEGQGTPTDELAVVTYTVDRNDSAAEAIKQWGRVWGVAEGDVTNSHEDAQRLAAAKASVLYTNPQGSQPQKTPKASACNGDLTGMKRRPSGSTKRQK